MVLTTCGKDKDIFTAVE